ncbi:DUF4367 domain-containing protein [Blautia intestinalis]|uniref:DUF4367 domain-containing protein n=1 Tax=Blautia intestinalis TaxID=2763028 RepID=UPI0022DF3F63|nr:DUF4367 domain-containing protein [Blautia intestinalis]
MKEKFEQEQKDNHNHIEDLTMDMPDMEDDEKFRQWLEETYINEAEQIEKSLLAGQEYEKNLDIAEELSVPREKFYQRLKEEGLYEEEAASDESAETLDENLEISAESVETLKKMDGASLAEETAETKTTGGKIISMEERASKVAGGAAKATSDKIIAMEPEGSKKANTAAKATEDFDSTVKTETVAVADMEVSSEKSSKNDRPVRKKRSYLRLGKVASVAGVCLMCVFAVSMTSEANRNYFIEGIRYLAGDDTRVVVGNDEENEDINTDEYEAIEDIKNKIGVEVPEFYYRPQGMKFYDYTIAESTGAAYIEYQYRDTMIVFYIDKQNEYTASNINIIKGEENTIDTISEDGVKITIKEIRDKEEVPTCKAVWSKNEVSYSLIGKMEVEDLKKIVEYMKF